MRTTITILLLLFILDSSAQSILESTVHLKNGSRLTGEIVDMNPQEFLLIKLNSGDTARIYFDEVKLIHSKPLRQLSYNQYISISPGIGNSYGMIGLRLQTRMGKKMGYGFHTGFGVYPDFYGTHVNPWFNIGFKYFFYHSFYLDIAVGTIEQNIINQEFTLEYGPSVLVGLDYFFNNRLGINAALGGASKFGRQGIGFDYLVFDLGFNLKIKQWD
jgi:hypothetical protein